MTVDRVSDVAGVLLIVEDTTVTVKCRTAIKSTVPLLELIIFVSTLSVMLNSFSCPLKSISFLTKGKSSWEGLKQAVYNVQGNRLTVNN